MDELRVKRKPTLERYRKEKLRMLKEDFCLASKLTLDHIDSVINASTYGSCDAAAHRILEELL